MFPFSNLFTIDKSCVGLNNLKIVVKVPTKRLFVIRLKFYDSPLFDSCAATSKVVTKLKLLQTSSVALWGIFICELACLLELFVRL